jgi:hypothetical protein
MGTGACLADCGGVSGWRAARGARGNPWPDGHGGCAVAPSRWPSFGPAASRRWQPPVWRSCGMGLRTLLHSRDRYSGARAARGAREYPWPDGHGGCAVASSRWPELRPGGQSSMPSLGVAIRVGWASHPPLQSGHRCPCPSGVSGAGSVGRRSRRADYGSVPLDGNLRRGGPWGMGLAPSFTVGAPILRRAGHAGRAENPWPDGHGGCALARPDGRSFGPAASRRCQPPVWRSVWDGPRLPRPDGPSFGPAASRRWEPPAWRAVWDGPRTLLYSRGTDVSDCPGPIRWRGDRGGRTGPA